MRQTSFGTRSELLGNVYWLLQGPLKFLNSPDPEAIEHRRTVYMQMLVGRASGVEPVYVISGRIS